MSDRVSDALYAYRTTRLTLDRLNDAFDLASKNLLVATKAAAEASLDLRQILNESYQRSQFPIPACIDSCGLTLEVAHGIDGRLDIKPLHMLNHLRLEVEEAPDLTPDLTEVPSMVPIAAEASLV